VIAIACTFHGPECALLILTSLDGATQTNGMLMRRLDVTAAHNDPLLVLGLGALASEPSYCWDVTTAESFARLLREARVGWCGPVIPLQQRGARDIADALRDQKINYPVRPAGQRTATEVATAVLMLARAIHG
jgi:hypothetical protein